MLSIALRKRFLFRLRLLHLFKALLLLVCAFSRLSFATSEPNQKLRFTRLDNPIGLTQNSISDIIQDREGFMWVATLGGLHKFDGVKFERMTLASVVTDEPIKGGEVQLILRIFEDSGNSLWIGGEQGRVFQVNKLTGVINDLTSKLNPLAFESKPTPIPSGKMFGGRVYSFFEDAQGRVWIGSGSGLAIYTLETGTVVINPKIAGGPGNWADVRDMASTANGQLWIGTSTGLYLVDPLKQQVLESLVHNADDPKSLVQRPITRLLVEKDKLWVGTLGDGVMRIDNHSLNIEKFRNDPANGSSLGANVVRDMMRDSSGRFWLTTEIGGLNLFQPKTNDFARFVKNKNSRFGMPNSNLWSIFEDRSGVIWIGTAGSGIVQLVPSTRKFSVVESVPYDDNSLSDDFVWNLAYDQSGLLWIATLDGLNSYDPTTAEVEVFRYSPLVPGRTRNNQVISLDNVGDNHLWLGTPQGSMYQFDLTTHQFASIGQPAYQGGFSGGRIWYMYYDSHQYMWISTADGTYRLSPKQQKQAVEGKTDFTPMTQQIARVVYEDESGRFWVGLQANGLMVLAPDMALLQHITNNPMKDSSLSHNTIRAINEDSFGNIWIGTHAGLNKMIRPQKGYVLNKFQHFYVSDGLPNDTIYSIINEGKYLWLSTNNGLSKLDPQSGQMQNYDVDDGLPANEFNGGAAIQSSDNTLYFGGVEGITYFKTANIIKNNSPPQLAITGFFVNNQAIGNAFSFNQLQDVELSYTDNNLTFHFAALDYHLPARNQVKFRLYPYQQEWETGVGGYTKYANLPSGKYQFQLMGSNNDDVWSEQIKSMKVTVNPPWWYHPVAYGVYAVLLLCFLFGYRQRVITQKLQLEAMVSTRTKDLASANDELAHSIEDLEEAREVAEHANELKSTFLANMSHEIRTPLTAIIGFTEHALNPHNNLAEQKGYLQRVLRSGQHLLHLINEILDLSKIEAEKLELEDQPIALFELLADIESYCVATAQENNLNFKVLYDYPLPEAFNGDLFRIRQILYNLCSNALKFTDEGQVSLLVRHLPQNKQLHFSIQDTGIGMSSEELKRLFQPFVQAASSITRQFGGSELGFVISQKLIHLMDGQLSVESTKGVGSHFDVFMPDNIDNPTLINEKPTFTRPEHHKEEVIRRYDEANVLVAEDNADNQVLIELLLKPFGVTLTIVENGMLAVESALLETYDLILMDIQMPVMGGVEAVALMRNTGIDCPIIALTANIMKEDIDMYLASGFDATLAKPIQNLHFYEAINIHLGRTEDKSADSLDEMIAQLRSGDEFKKLQQRFKTNIPQFVSELDTHLSTKDWENIRQQAHSIKGSAASMGFPQLTEQATIIESYVMEGEHDEAEEAVKQFIQTCETLM